MQNKFFFTIITLLSLFCTQPNKKSRFGDILLENISMHYSAKGFAKELLIYLPDFTIYFAKEQIHSEKRANLEIATKKNVPLSAKNYVKLLYQNENLVVMKMKNQLQGRAIGFVLNFEKSDLETLKKYQFEYLFLAEPSKLAFKSLSQILVWGSIYCTGSPPKKSGLKSRMRPRMRIVNSKILSDLKTRGKKLNQKPLIFFFSNQSNFLG